LTTFLVVHLKLLKSWIEFRLSPAKRLISRRFVLKAAGEEQIQAL